MQGPQASGEGVGLSPCLCGFVQATVTCLGDMNRRALASWAHPRPDGGGWGQRHRAHMEPIWTLAVQTLQTHKPGVLTSEVPVWFPRGTARLPAP